MVDNVNGTKVPRFLIYDIVVYEVRSFGRETNDEIFYASFQTEMVGQRPFRERLDLIRRSIVGVRNEAITKGTIDRNFDPFSIRNKDFWDLSAVPKVKSDWPFLLALSMMAFLANLSVSGRKISISNRP